MPNGEQSITLNIKVSSNQSFGNKLGSIFIVSTLLLLLTNSGIMIWRNGDDLVVKLPLDTGLGNSCHMAVEVDVDTIDGQHHGGGGHLHNGGNWKASHKVHVGLLPENNKDSICLSYKKCCKVNVDCKIPYK